MTGQLASLVRHRPAAKQYTFMGEESSQPKTVTLLLRLGSDQIPLYVSLPSGYPAMSAHAGVAHTNLEVERSAVCSDSLAGPSVTYGGWFDDRMDYGDARSFSQKVLSNFPCRHKTAYFRPEPAIQEDLFRQTSETLRIRLRDAIQSWWGRPSPRWSSWTELNEIAMDTHFEDGMENRLSRRLSTELAVNGSACLATFKTAFESGQLSEATTIESLKYFGRARDSDTRTQRVGLLISFLKADRLSIRDAAAIGLSYTHDAFCLQALKDAVLTESDSDLREFMVGVIEDLGSENALGTADEENKKEPLDIGAG